MIGKDKEAMEAIRKIETGSIKLAIAFVALNILDIVLTRMADMNGTLCEANPVMRHFIEQSSWGAVWGIKFSVVAFVVALLLIESQRFPGFVQKLFIVLVGVMTGVCVVNLIGVL